MIGQKWVRKIASIILILLVVFGVCLYTYMPSVPGLFRLNKECQEEGYYMAEFEFKMLGLAYDLDKGHYWKAVTSMRRLQQQLKSREGLVKLPKFADKKQELAFYLNLQNPRTGAFMDDAYPFCTYHSPTENVLLHLEALAKETGQPLRLKFPLKYLDEISTPPKLKQYLDDISVVGWIGAKFPQTSFHFARDILISKNEGVLERNNLYAFSPAWQQALIQWFYENQDPETGFWGPRSRSSGKLVKLDLNNTASIVKTFVDRNGNNIHAAFPLQYEREMFATALHVMSGPIPADDELDEWHEWALKMGKGTYLLTRYLWHSASEENRTKAEQLLGRYVQTRFKKYYIPEEGAFSYYPGSKHATLDGTSGGIGCFLNVGAFSKEEQKRLWGDPEKTCSNLGNFDASILTEKDFDFIKGFEKVNSWRFYHAVPTPEDYTAKAVGVFYPDTTPVLDIIELVPKMRHWIQTTSQSMGNWVSREEILRELSDIRIEPVPVSKGEIPLEQVNDILKKSKAVTAIGFDVLQIPRYRITFHLK